MGKNVKVIPATKKSDIQVGIYCRVSATSKKQLRSLSDQISGLFKYVVTVQNS